MPETDEQREKRLLKELEGKNVAYYQTLLSAWIHTRMERDKTVIMLSMAAIGLLVTILTVIGISGVWQRILVVCAFVGFVGAIWIGLRIYELNAAHLVDSLKGGSGKDLKLERFDKWSKAFFYFGIISMIILGLVASFNRKEGSMTDKEQNPKQDSSQKEQLKESVNGVQKLSPKDLEIGKSLSGIGNLSPQNLESTSLDSSQNNTGSNDEAENNVDKENGEQE